MKPQKTYAILIVAIAAASSGLTFQAIELGDNAPAGTADKSGIYGHITATLYDEDDYIKAYRQTDNRIVDRGLDLIADQVFNGMDLVANNQTVQAMAIGTGVGGSAVGDLDLNSRAGLGGACANQTATFAQGAATTGIINVTTTASFLGANGCNGTITEAGLFDGLAGAPTDNLFARQLFTGIVVGGSDQLDITWSVQINDDGNE